MKQSRAERKAWRERIGLLVGLKRGTVIRVDATKIFSRSVMPSIPEFYRDEWFRCKDCGEKELWTAKQRQRWHEEQGGEIEAIAVRCRACRTKEKQRKAEARRVHLEGLHAKAEQKSRTGERQT